MKLSGEIAVHTDNLEIIRANIRTIPDFPKKGINFFDICSLLKHPVAFRACIEKFAEHYTHQNIDVLAGLESRGFIFVSTLALMMEKPFVLIRKPGKLPGNTVSISYEKEYGSDLIEMQEGAIKEGQKVLIIDDLVATAGSAQAAAQLIEKLGGIVHEVACVIEITELRGREKLSYPLYSLLKE
ncbi:MAG: adenine phosphoribosyltransferase [Waddliaceae bacterium]|nr:adenine phosphoribosyltransferase [Waddliaceae bacterium]